LTAEPQQHTRGEINSHKEDQFLKTAQKVRRKENIITGIRQGDVAAGTPVLRKNTKYFDAYALVNSTKNEDCEALQVPNVNRRPTIVAQRLLASAQDEMGLNPSSFGLFNKFETQQLE